MYTYRYTTCLHAVVYKACYIGDCFIYPDKIGLCYISVHQPSVDPYRPCSTHIQYTQADAYTQKRTEIYKQKHTLMHRHTHIHINKLNLRNI